MPSPASDGTSRILLVEDEDDLAGVVTLNLELAGHDVTRVGDGHAAIDTARAEPFDLVLLDVMLPGASGWEVLRTLKGEDATRDIPVVMLTALSEERDIIEGHLRGAVRYMTKPFQIDDLLTNVDEALAPPDEEELARRRARVRDLLTRLAELDAGRASKPDRTVHLSRLEITPRQDEAAPSRQVRSRLGDLTDKQRYVAEQLGAGRSARELAEELDVSRSNVYATRKRIARKLGVQPGEVADIVARLLA